MNAPKKSKFWDSSRLIIVSFLGIILLGTLLLMLPQAANGDPVSFIDALFTATSATCVTGLIVVDTGTKFTCFGQLVILFLIQVGGLGIMTFSTFFIFLVIGRFSIYDREVIQETLTQSPIKNIASLLRTVFISTILIEGVGTLLLAFCLWGRLPLIKAFYYSGYHSVAAFCNAGFSLFSNNLMDYAGDWRVNLIIMSLIVSGGIGFVVLNEFKRLLFIKRRHLTTAFSFHSKIALTITAILIFGGALVIFLLEYNNIFLQQPVDVKILAALFQSVTTRTAGFNTVDISRLTDASLVFMIMLMFIGASPGSTGGGIKTTTAGVVIALMLAHVQNREDVNLAQRRIPDETIAKAISVTFFAGVVILLGTLILMIFEQGGISHQQTRGLFLETLFEVTSALGTVGLSTGITPTLSPSGKFIITLLMFVGRLGPLTLVMAIGKKIVPRFRYVQAKVLIG